MVKDNPIYSICICNYNMAETIEQSLVSVLEQIDNRYEVLLLDDGSSDDSVSIVKGLQKKYHNLRLLALKRDRKRFLGETRNMSIREARGKYVILHVDTDDVWGPFIDDFVSVFHKLEDCMNKDFLLSGQQINLGRKDFLLSHGPYRNIYHTEDRDMWLRLASVDAYQPIQHVVFRDRLKRPTKTKIYRLLKDTIYHLINDMLTRDHPRKYVYFRLKNLFIKSEVHFLVSLVSFLAVIPCYFITKFMDPFPIPDNMKNGEFYPYREKENGTYSEIMERNSGSSDLSFLKPDAQAIFANK